MHSGSRRGRGRERNLGLLRREVGVQRPVYGYRDLVLRFLDAGVPPSDKIRISIGFFLGDINHAIDGTGISRAQLLDNVRACICIDADDFAEKDIASENVGNNHKLLSAVVDLRGIHIHLASIVECNALGGEVGLETLADIKSELVLRVFDVWVPPSDKIGVTIGFFRSDVDIPIDRAGVDRADELKNVGARIIGCRLNDRELELLVCRTDRLERISNLNILRTVFCVGAMISISLL